MLNILGIMNCGFSNLWALKNVGVFKIVGTQNCRYIKSVGSQKIVLWVLKFVGIQNSWVLKI